MDTNIDITPLAERARQAGRELSQLSGKVRRTAIKAMGQALSDNRETIKLANAEDVEAARQNGLEGPLLKRLELNNKAFDYMAKRLMELSNLPDPLGIITKGHTRPSGLRVHRVSVPLGVIGIIYESRPNVTTDAASVCVYSGNAVILRGGSIVRGAPRCHTGYPHSRPCCGGSASAHEGVSRRHHPARRKITYQAGFRGKPDPRDQAL